MTAENNNQPKPKVKEPQNPPPMAETVTPEFGSYTVGRATAKASASPTPPNLTHLNPATAVFTNVIMRQIAAGAPLEMPAHKTARGLRETTVLQMQQNYGNATTVQCLFAQSPSLPTIHTPFGYESTHIIQQRNNLPSIQRYGDPIPRVANPSVVTMAQFIELVRRIEAANSGTTALQIAQLIMRTKYHSQGWDYLLPSSSGGRQVTVGGGVTGSDVTTLSGEFEVTLPQGGQSDPSHIVTAIVANAETQAPGAGGSGGLSGRLIQQLPAGLSQRDVTTWVGDVASAAAEWATAHPHPSGGTTKQNYIDEYAPESDLIADIDGIAMTSRNSTVGFAFDPAASLSSNLEHFYFPTGAREGKNRRFHIFCIVEGLGLEADGVTLNTAAIAAINNRVQLNTEWFERNDPNLTAWMGMQSRGLINPIRDAWIARANDWRWFAEKFTDFVQRNLRAEGP